MDFIIYQVIQEEEKQQERNASSTRPIYGFSPNAFSSTSPGSWFPSNDDEHGKKLTLLAIQALEEKEKEERSYWIDGIVSSMVEAERYNPEQGIIKLSDKRLFKTELNFSAELVDGEYLVDTLLLKEGNVIAARRSFINVSKSGFGEKIYKTAKNNRLSYGFISVFFAIVFGFFVHESIRRLNA